MSDAEFDAIEDALEPLYKHGNDQTNSFDPYRGMWLRTAAGARQLPAGCEAEGAPSESR